MVPPSLSQDGREDWKPQERSLECKYRPNGPKRKRGRRGTNSDKLTLTDVDVFRYDFSDCFIPAF